MADYTLGVQITGDASKMQKAFEKAQEQAEKLKEKVKKTNQEMASEFDLAGKSLTDFSGKMKDIGQSMSEFGSKISDVGSSLTQKITLPLAAGVGYAVKQFADLEQAVGGVETLFKQSAKEVIKNSEKAYKTAGISGTKYMEQVTSFSASLLQGLGGDTAKAAKVANKAVIDMSDNANKMGTSIELIQNAYQGFAKGNYTMLDNLKLGFGGTKEEMKRLLEEAEKLSGVHYDIENFADIIEAIHVIQNELEITGTTAKEGSTTVSGSFQAMLASANNLAAGLGDKNADVKRLMAELEETTKQFVTNVSNVLKTIWDNLPLEPWQRWTLSVVALAGPVLLVFGKLTVGIASLVSSFGIISGAIAPFFTWMSGIVSQGGAVSSVISSLGGGLSGFAALASAVIAVITLIVYTIQDLWKTSEKFRGAVTGIFATLGNIVQSAWTSFLQPVFTALKAIILSIVDESLIPLYDSFKQSLEDIAIELSTFLKIAEPFISTLADLFGKIIPPILEILGANFKCTFAIISNVMTVAFQTISGIVKNLLKVLGGIITFITGVFTGNWRKAWQGVVNMLGGIFGGIGVIMKGAINGVIGVINGAIGGINSLIGTVNKIPGVDIGTIGSIPYLARGTDNWQGGFARINEGGRGELAYMPSGAVVVPHDVSMKYAKESARAQSGMIMVSGNDEIAKNALKLANEAVKRPVILRVNGRDLAVTTGKDFANYQERQTVTLKRMRGEL
ncbi:hypothetical protein ACFKI6_02535 [Streptococcus agalactiae]|uniref:phage tail protein n=1 Tax=Streptococcus agalactiae TaxID=1311 RepID=UPI0006AC66F5|nr:hypothetical protein [Streptococcus agalactiae]ALB15171.1 hypothetical protein AMD29_00830 [Streptococcus agalactiae]AMQ13756.1 hypothetical protein CUGBS08_00160 [Streptococcus agalactiae]ANR96249.1 hypothetical protein A9256_00840 [Streptococcus agalactiae]ASA80971.1 hypothetical protein BB197_00850 [Streptococcus agalactiae]ASA83023.1 hypothetical protein BB194_00850 [Streptococcus agalactiae]